MNAMHAERCDIESGGIILVGELVVPDSPPPWPGVVLLHGSSWGERRFNRALAETFAAAGIASLIFDRRGDGESGGTNDMDFAVLAADSRAAHRTLAARPDIDATRVGLWGFSNGAWVAGLAASGLPDVAFLLVTGAAGVTPADAEAYRRTADLRAQGIAETTLVAVERWWRIFFAYLSAGDWDPAWDAELGPLAATIGADTALHALPVPEFVRANPVLASVPRTAALEPGERDIMAGRVPSMAFDPIPTLARLRCPVLILLGSGDANLPVAPSLARFEPLAAARADGSFAVEVIPGSDHAFTRPGAERERGAESRPMAASDFRPEYLARMTDWLRAVTAAS
jgi:dienelactone hydrolase